MIRFEDLLEKVRAYNPDADLELLRRAYVFSALEHKGQVRHSGEPYLVHPLEVADILADMQPGRRGHRGGPAPRRRRGHAHHDRAARGSSSAREVAHVVEGVTKIGAIPFSSSEERQAENFRKMLLAMVDDIRVILVKLADRLHNMRTLQLPAGGAAAADRPGDARHLRADRQPARHEQDQERARGARLPLPRAARRTKSLRARVERQAAGHRGRHRGADARTIAAKLDEAAGAGRRRSTAA